MEDISPSKDKGILKEIVRTGESDEKPIINDRVFIHYVGTLLDGTKFDSSRDRNKRFEFDLGKGTVIKALEIGVATMTRGEICRLTCQPEYACGEQNIKQNSPVVFEIELLDFIGEDLSEEKDQSILLRVLKKSEEWSRPNDTSRVEISLKGIHENQTFDERTVKFTLGEGFLQNIPEGLECAITKMCKGDYCQIKLKFKATIGLENFQLPKNAQVEYRVTLLNFEKGINKWLLNDQEKLIQSEVLKKRAGELIKNGHYRVAWKKYKKILDYLQSANYEDEKDIKKCHDLLLATHSNMALCHLKSAEFAQCIRSCEKALELDVDNEKCLFRRGQSQMSLLSYEEAIDDFQHVLKLNPNNSAAKQALQSCRDYLKGYQQREKQLYSNIFKKFSQTNDEETK